MRRRGQSRQPDTDWTEAVPRRRRFECEMLSVSYSYAIGILSYPIRAAEKAGPGTKTPARSGSGRAVRGIPAALSGLSHTTHEMLERLICAEDDGVLAGISTETPEWDAYFGGA